MNQTRNLLFFAWLAVATLLWMAWSADHAPKATAANVPMGGATTPLASAAAAMAAYKPLAMAM